MADFRDIRKRLQLARFDRNTLDTQLFRNKEKLKKIRKRKTNVQRILNPDNSEIQERFIQISQQEKETLDLINRGKASLFERNNNLKIIFEEFAGCSDPREFIGQLNDLYPILLFPLRIETRFKSNMQESTGERQQELWVRVFPDDALIDSFEEDLSESEVESARLFWINYWKAGGMEDLERAAWKGMVDNFGSGRSGYIIQKYSPVNSDDQPQKELTDDLILVIAAEEAIPVAEKPFIAAYWESVWKADGNSITIQQAMDALINALGANRAEEISINLVPFNLIESLDLKVPREEIEVQTAFLQLPKLDELDTQESSWAHAPKVNLLPDRLVFMAYQNGEKVLEVLGNQIPSPLYVGPDPQADKETQVSLEDGDLKVNEELEWMLDFEKALEIGMGFKIQLSPSQARAGFDKILVLGVRLSSDELESQQLLEDLFQHHHFGPTGISLLKQGTPTNNTEKEGAGFSVSEDADDSFSIYVNQEETLELTNDWMLKKDGQILAEKLGIDPNVIRLFPNANASDQCEAKAMNTALWPATLGYFMESMMQPIFSDNTIKNTQRFFNQHVRGRGGIPSIRIAEQPYGILPTTVFSKLNWFNPNRERTWNVLPGVTGKPNFYRELYRIINIIQSDWIPLLDQVSYVGKKGPDIDAHQILLDALGLHATSIKFHQRYAESFAQFYNRLLAQTGNPGVIWQTVIALAILQAGNNLLVKLGANLPDDPADYPEILQKFFYTKQNLMKGGLIDDRPLSEEKQIRAYTEEGANYIQWLIDAANTSHDALRKQEGFVDNRRPTALLYLMLQHALDLSYIDAGLTLHFTNDIISVQEAFVAKREPAFLHVQTAQNFSDLTEGLNTLKSNTESKWQYLYKADERITDNPNLQIAEYIPTVLNGLLFNSTLNQQIKALEHLKNAPTARLERAFAEHLDCCHYRLDAWKQGLLDFQLDAIRKPIHSDGDSSPNPDGSPNEGPNGSRGIFLGSFGWLEDIRPENKKFEEAELSEELVAIFNQEGLPPVQTDSTNQGFIHAPSLNHAVTAAILRNGYLSNATPEDPDLLSVNLSSERVRRALIVLDGIRNGQSLAALLGYQLERGLHDSA